MEFNFLYPIGALTSKPYSFVSRPWEIEVISSFDYYDSLILPIKFSCRGGFVVRVLPENLINFDRWISDKIRFSYDGFYTQRIIRPQIKLFNNIYKDLSWSTALRYWYLYMSPLPSLEFYMGSDNDLIDQTALTNFNSFLGYYPNSNFFKFSILDPTMFVNNNYSGLDQMFQDLENSNSYQKFVLLLIGGVNLRYEFPNLNLRLRKFVKKNNLTIYNFGSFFNSGYQNFPYFSLGSKISELSNVLFSRNVKFLDSSFNSTFYMVTVPSLFLRSDCFQIYSILNNFYLRMSKYFSKYLKVVPNILNLLPDPASSSKLFLGLSSYNYQFTYKNNCLLPNKISCLVNTNEVELLNTDRDFKIYCAHHYSNDKKFNFDLILPTPLSWEVKNQFYVNLFGNFRISYSSNFLQPYAPLSRKFVLILRNFVSLFLKFNSLFKWLNKYFNFYLISWLSSFWLSSLLFKNLDSYYSKFFEIQNFSSDLATGSYSLNLNRFTFLDYKLNNHALMDFYFNNFYQTDLISKSSYLMAVSSIRFNSYNYNFLNVKY